MLTFKFSGAEGTMTVPQVLTSGMVGKHLLVEFSPEWEGLTKTLAFSNGSVTRDVIFTGNPVTIPAEVLEEPLKELTVGAYGLGSEGNPVIPTVRARGPVILPGVQPSGDPSTDPTLPVWAQILAQLGNLDDLDTEARENLVAAVNELLARLDAIPEPDKTLTLEGVAADAEAVGVRFAQAAEQVEEQIRELKANLGGSTRPGSVVNYGAKGDGATDDTQAFQDALNENRVVFVPGGTYKLSSELVIGDNCCLELSQDTVLEFTQTSGNCITLGMLSHLKGNHATVKVPYAFDGHVLHAYSGDHTTPEQQAVPPWSKWDPQWKSGRYVSDLNICKADSRGFHYAVNPGECKGAAVYISANNTSGLLTYMWGICCSGLRIAGAFAYGIHAQNFDNGWVHEMRVDAFIDACEVGVCLEDCNNTYISAIIQPRRAYTVDKVYVPYAKHGIKLVRSKNTDLSGSRVWDWNAMYSLWAQDNEYQHIAMYGDCSGTILNDFVYHSQGDTRKRIYTDTKSNLDQLTILQEPVDRWFKIRNGDPYYSDGFAERKLVTQEILDEHFSTDVVKNFTDILPTATDADGSVFGDVGYKWGYLLGNGNFEESAYYMTTGFIPLKVGQTLYVDGITYATCDGFCRICAYDADKNFVSVAGAQNVVNGNYYYIGYTPTANGFALSLKNVVGNAGVAFVRLSAYKRNVSDNPMASVDEPIKYTVEGFLADGVKVKGENVIGTPGQITPDWVATKEAMGGGAVVIPEQTVSGSMWKNLQMSLQPGVSYDVTINGQVYTCVAIADGQGVTLGNNTSLTLNDYPFCVYWAGGTAVSGMFFKNSSAISSPITLKVTDSPSYVYDKLPEGYLPACVVKSVNGREPDGFGNVNVETAGGSGVDVTAEVGQTIVVEEVDANGKPTKWEAVDHQPRTHWTKDVVLYEGIPEYDGEGGALVFTAPAPTIGNTYKVICNGAEYVCVCADSAVMGEPGAYLLGNFSAFMGTGDTGEPFLMTYVDGTWAGMMLDGTTSVNLTLKERQHTPIPVEYVSNAFPYYIDITGSGTDESPCVCNDTVANVEAILATGREVIARIHYFNDEGIENATFFARLNFMALLDTGWNLFFLGDPLMGFRAEFVRVILTPNDSGMYDVEIKILE